MATPQQQIMRYAIKTFFVVLQLEKEMTRSNHASKKLQFRFLKVNLTLNSYFLLNCTAVFFPIKVNRIIILRQEKIIFEETKDSYKTRPILLEILLITHLRNPAIVEEKTL